ncbi:flagellar brake protein [Gracilibacillus marinus]|uniref:Flagellar brake protein n=1 Tax=Gracilibacillus marinus TaxID=630535 RepID=A0ABV8VT69_9BACI
MLKNGAFLQLKMYKKDNDTDKELDVFTFKCKIIEIIGDNITVDLPTNEYTGKTTLLPKDTMLEISCVRDNSVYIFPAKVIGKKMDNIPCLVFYYMKDKVKKIQRREFVRINALLDISIKSTQKKFKDFTTLTRDISGGGLSVIINKNQTFEKDDYLDLLVVLPLGESIEYIKVNGSVVRVHEEEAKSILSIKFSDIMLQDQQKIVKYCYLEQVKMKRKERGM